MSSVEGQPLEPVEPVEWLACDTVQGNLRLTPTGLTGLSCLRDHVESGERWLVSPHINPTFFQIVRDALAVDRERLVALGCARCNRPSAGDRGEFI